MLGVIVAPETPAPPEFIIARNAAVLGEGGGKATGPPTRGTRGVRPVEGVRPVRNVPEGSKPNNGGCTEAALAARAATDVDGCDALDAAGWVCGPASIAGDNGPERNELEMPAEENDHEYDGSDGDVIDASGGSIGFGVSPSFPVRELLRECAFPFDVCEGDFLSDGGEPALTVLAPSLLSGTLLPVAAALSDDRDDEERDVRDETEKDCSKGLGSKSKLFRSGGRARD